MMEATTIWRRECSILHERRHEPFRYPFYVPLPGFYNKKTNRHISGPISINDISMNGLRFSAAPEPGLSTKDEVFLSFIYENETFTAEGRVIWLKSEDQNMTCGVHVFGFPDRLKNIIQQLGDSLDEVANPLSESQSP
ncbi:PilZ domain-containing protein [Halobacillus litoralis]|uniref:PilZ domain-containing protein n=1 Tax=Halobacillus litoralis TaxID=45668 RepID=UPI0032B38694